MKKKLFAFVCALTLCAALLTGCGMSAINAAGIQNPEEIEAITVEMRDGKTWTFEDRADIKRICDFIEAAVPTEYENVSGEPVGVSYGTITLMHTGPAVIYYYEKDGKYYLESPFSCTYQTKEDFEKAFQDDLALAF